MSDAVLVVNAGSSSLKFALFERADGASVAVSHGQIESIGDAPHFVVHDAAGRMLGENRWPGGGAETHETLLGHLLDWVDMHLGADALVAVGHRVVHGGASLHRPARVTDALLDTLAGLTPLAPLHQPHNLTPIRAIAARRPGLPQVACFDTGFHHSLAPVATRFALPRRYETEGVRRYGFHGLSYEYIARRLRDEHPALAAGRVIVAHLGNGASLCAMHDGRSVDTTMGFTALDGLVMGTRCGSIDPGAVLYLQQHYGLPADEVERLLYHDSGLLGVSGISGDMRQLIGRREKTAKDAIELFVYRIAREAGALAASLGGLDGFVFTAGIGEHAPAVRGLVVARLGWLGATLDPCANTRGHGRISDAGSRIEVHVIPTDEEAMIARHTFETLEAGVPQEQRP